MPTKRSLSILELNWYQRLGGKKRQLNICRHVLTSSTQLQKQHISRNGKDKNGCEVYNHENCRYKACKTPVFFFNMQISDVLVAVVIVVA